MPRRSTPKSRVGLREIAGAADLSVMAVSLALRDSPKISAATRERVRQLARELGYQPDPELSRLMRHLRSSRTLSGTTGLAIVDFYPAGYEEHDYNQSIRESALRRAQQLGLGVTMIHGADYKLNVRSMLNVVRNRGLEGAILLPPVVPLALDPAIAWNGISVVATSNSILSPHFHCVVPNQFANMMRLIETVQAQGFRRICGIFDEHFDERTAHHFTAALTWHHHGSRILVLPKSLQPAARRELVESWVAKHRPDLVFAQSADAVGWAESHVKRKRPQREPEIVALSAPSHGDFSYIDENPELVGSGAVDLLAGMMYYHETGIPSHPRTTMIEGSLCFSRSFQARELDHK
jgi:DNA-binding LacI/PurR family transcriptional regulator